MTSQYGRIKASDLSAAARKLGEASSGGNRSGGTSAAASKLGVAGGKVGGPARARALTAKERSQIAAEGGRARHGKHREKG